MRRGLYTEGNLRYKIDWASLQLELNLCAIYILLRFISYLRKFLEPLAYTIAS